MGMSDPNVPEQDTNSDIIWTPSTLGLPHEMLNVNEMNKKYNLSSSAGNIAMRGYQQTTKEFEEAQPDWSNVSMVNVYLKVAEIQQGCGSQLPPDSCEQFLKQTQTI